MVTFQTAGKPALAAPIAVPFEAQPPRPLPETPVEGRMPLAHATM